MRSGKEFKEKPKQKESSLNANERFEEWAKKEGIKVRVTEGDRKVTAVFKPKKKR